MSKMGSSGPLILLLLQLLVHTTTSFRHPFPTSFCSSQVDPITCISEVFCIKNVDELQNIGDSSICPGKYYEGRVYYFDKMYLHVKNIDPVQLDGSESVFMDNRQDLAHLVYSLDFSDNSYFSVPTLTTMPNLHIYNLSNNALTEAKFSNPNNLESLEEIDYSHNTISEIKIQSSEYPYRKLKKINLSYNYLVAIEEAVFDSFTDLESLDLSNNFIDSVNMLTFEGIKNLLHLNFKHNRLSELNSALVRFSKLTELDLSENKFEYLKTADFEKLVNLKILDVNSNVITSVDKKVFSTMAFLERLDLSGNILEQINRETFANLSALVDIDLSKNRFMTLPKDLFKDKDFISKFSIKDNKLEGPLVKGTFAGLKLISELDLSNQQLSSIEDFAFYGLEKVVTLLLNNNHLETLSKKSFNSLRSLEILDLSNNCLSNIEFEKDDLISLRSLLLEKNLIHAIKHEYFTGLNNLQFLDLSNNNISSLDTDSFKSLRELVNFQISNNPISGVLEESTFRGLTSLPSLDISNTLLTLVKNGSFDGMNQLKDLNVSHSRVTELQFNSFLHTGHIETIDVSFNQLRDFNVNTTELVNLQNLILNNNFLVSISSSIFQGLPRLMKIGISHNNIQSVDKEAFRDQSDLRHLDLSYNRELKLDVSQFEKTSNMISLLLSGIRTNITFSRVKDIHLSHLEMSHSEITNVTAISLKQLNNLDDLVLSHNNISDVEVEAFSGIKNLRKLDLSFNKITHIQPGAFKDNVLLNTLNISHNSLKALRYGTFRGLLYLDTIDMSYNEIGDLQSERFYEVRSLSVLIADHNRITAVNADEFAGTSLTKLSIGDNPIPCHVLVNLKRASISFIITAIDLQENKNENVDGITCNKDNLKFHENEPHNSLGNEKVLFDIRDILRNYTLNKKYSEKSPGSLDSFQYFANITSEIDRLGSNFSETVNKTTLVLEKVSSKLTEGTTNTNTLLDKIYKVLVAINTVRRSNAIPVPKENVTNEFLIPYINRIKQELEDTIAVEKQDILNEVDNKIQASLAHSHKESLLLSAKHEAYSSESGPDSKSFIFIEVCVALILVILVLFILYKFYNSGMFVPSRHSTSTRHLSDVLENSAL